MNRKTKKYYNKTNPQVSVGKRQHTGPRLTHSEQIAPMVKVTRFKLVYNGGMSPMVHNARALAYLHALAEENHTRIDLYKQHQTIAEQKDRSQQGRRLWITNHLNTWQIEAQEIGIQVIQLHEEMCMLLTENERKYVGRYAPDLLDHSYLYYDCVKAGVHARVGLDIVLAIADYWTLTASELLSGKDAKQLTDLYKQRTMHLSG